MRRRILIGLAVLALLVVIIDDVLGRISLERPRVIVEQLISDAAGLEFRIEGNLGFGLLPGLHVEATQLVLENAEGRPSAHLAEIGRVDLWLRVWPLLFGALDIYRIDIVDAQVHIDPDPRGKIEIPQEVAELILADPAAKHDIYIREARYRNLDVFVNSADGSPVLALHFDELLAAEDDWNGPIDLEARGHFDGGPFDLRGRLGSYSALIDPGTPFDIDVEGRFLEATGACKGSIQNPLALEGIDLDFDFDLPNAGARLRERGMKLPPLGAIHLTGRLVEPDGTLGLEDLVLVTQEHEPIRLRLTGSIEDLEAFRGVDLSVELEAPDAGLLEPYLEQTPDLERIRVEATLSDAHGQLGIVGKGRAEARGGRVTLEVEGEHLDLSRVADLDVGLHFRATNLKLIGEALHFERPLPEIGPLSATARLRDRDGVFALDDINIDLGRREDTWAHLEGSIGDVQRLRRVQLASEFGAREPRQFEAFLGRKLPQIGSLQGQSELSDSDGSLGLERFSLRAGREGAFDLEVTGSFDDLRDIDEIRVDARFWARDLTVVGELIDADLPAIGSVEFEGQIRGSDEKLDSHGTLQLDKTRFTGSWSASFPPDTRPRVTARLHSPHVHLDDLGVAPQAPGAVAAPARLGTTEQAPRRVLPLAPPADPLTALRSFDAVLDLDFDRVTGRQGLDVQAVEFDLLLDHGDLRIQNLSAVYKTGALKGRFRLDARSARPAVALALDATGIDGPQFWAQISEDAGHRARGDVDLYADLRTRGKTLRELLAGMTGSFGLMIREGTLVSAYGQALVRRLVRVSLPSLRGRETDKVGCMRVEFEVEDGLAEVRTLQLNGAEVTVVGEGSVDFGGKGYDLLLTPRAHNPAVLGLAATVRVTGPLEDPVFSPVPRSLATSAVRGLLSNALRPAAAVLSPFRRAREIPDPCAAPFGADLPAVAAAGP